MRAPKGRRRFLGGLLAAGLVPRATWASAGSPAYLSAAATADGRFVLCGIGPDLGIRFIQPLPARGHAAAAHPLRPEAVAFARRPGIFAVVLACATGQQIATLTAPEGRHFYGHGVFSSTGDLLFTTENDYETGRGCIGVWDARMGYARVAEWDSGGVGPHDIKRLPGRETLVIANGGIDTHPDTGRTKLNIPTMRPNLTYLESGAVVDQVALSPDLHKNSIRHLSIGPGGDVAFGTQWQGEGAVRSLVGVHRRGGPLVLMTAPAEDLHRMQGYVGSIAWSAGGGSIAVTSPRGGVLQTYDTTSRRLTQVHDITDVCGVATCAEGFTVTSGTGALQQIGTARMQARQVTDLQWDNHLIGIARG